MEALNQLLSVQFISFSLMLSAITYVERKVFEFFSNKKKEDIHPGLWDMIFSILPILIGGIIGFAFKQYPYPGNSTDSLSRIIFGVVAGLFSSQVYRIAVSFLNSKIIPAISSASNSNETK